MTRYFSSSCYRRQGAVLVREGDIRFGDSDVTCFVGGVNSGRHYPAMHIDSLVKLPGLKERAPLAERQLVCRWTNSTTLPQKVKLFADSLGVTTHQSILRVYHKLKKTPEGL